MNRLHHQNERFSLACKNGNLDVVQKLSQKSDVHFNNEEALRYAVWGGSLDVVKYLVEELKCEITPTVFRVAKFHNRGDILSFFSSKSFFLC